MVSSAGLLLGLIQFMIWLRDRRRTAYLLAAVMAGAAGTLALLELGLMTSRSAADYQTLVWWNNLAIFAILVPMTWFVYLYLGTARRWLAIAITAAWVAGVLVNIAMPGNLTFSSIVALRMETTFWGERFAMAEGVANPFKLVAEIASLLIAFYVADASLRAYRRGLRRQALTIGGSILFFIVVAGVHTPLVDAGLVKTPFMISFTFTAIALAMAVELVDEVTRAAVYGRELEAWQTKWRSLLNDIQLAVVGLDRDGRINYINRFFRSLTGFSQARLLGQPAASLAPSTQLGEFEQWLAAVPVRGLRPSIQFPVKTASGEHRELVWSTVMLRNGDGAYDGLLSIGKDITKELRTQGELHRTQREIERLTRAIIVGELGSTLAHELNQPLAAILSNAQAAQRMLGAGAPDLNEIREILADIVADDRRAGEVIDRMRRMLKNGEVANDRFDLNTAIREVLVLIEGERKKHDVAIAFDPTPKQVEVYGGRVQIQQVVMNLVLNAVRAVQDLPAGDRQVRIATFGAGDGASIVVEDSGPGVAEDMASRIFEPFVTTKDAGLGMGLAISRRIVETHGGRIQLAKGNLGGARFEAILPLRPLRAREEEEEKEVVEKAAAHA
jgi:PAS domain S-box-containing protein